MDSLNQEKLADLVDKLIKYARGWHSSLAQLFRRLLDMLSNSLALDFLKIAIKFITKWDICCHEIIIYNVINRNLAKVIIL